MITNQVLLIVITVVITIIYFDVVVFHVLKEQKQINIAMLL